MEEQTIRCPICGQAYVFYPFKAGDQTACPDCVWKARRRELGCEGEEGWKKDRWENRDK